MYLHLTLTPSVSSRQWECGPNRGLRTQDTLTRSKGSVVSTVVSAHVTAGGHFFAPRPLLCICLSTRVDIGIPGITLKLVRAELAAPAPALLRALEVDRRFGGRAPQHGVDFLARSLGIHYFT